MSTFFPSNNILFKLFGIITRFLYTNSIANIGSKYFISILITLDRVYLYLMGWGSRPVCGILIWHLKHFILILVIILYFELFYNTIVTFSHKLGLKVFPKIN